MQEIPDTPSSSNANVVDLTRAHSPSAGICLTDTNDSFSATSIDVDASLNAASTKDEKTRKSYLASKEDIMVLTFLKQINCDSTFMKSRDIISDKNLPKMLNSLSYQWNTYTKLKSEYQRSKKYERKPTLTTKIDTITSTVLEFSNALSSLNNMDINETMSAFILSQTYLKRAEAISQIILLGARLKTLFTTDLFNALRRRIKQQQAADDVLYSRSLMNCSTCFV